MFRVLLEVKLSRGSFSRLVPSKKKALSLVGEQGWGDLLVE
jgi:hypothetical protein